MNIDLKLVEETAKDLYIRALKILPDDVKQGFDRLARTETNPRARAILGTMIQNIAVAEGTDNLTCQDTGVPIYNVTIVASTDFAMPRVSSRVRRSKPCFTSGGRIFSARM